MVNISEKTKGFFFLGKVVVLYLNNPPEGFSSGIAIRYPKIEELN